MTLTYTPALGRRLVATLFTAQSLASAGLIATFTVNPLVGARLSGNDALAGLPGTLLQIGAATAAYPAGQLMARAGRRVGLTLGFFAGMLGMLIAGIATMQSSFPLFLLGLAFIGASRGSIDQSRYAAADAQPIEQRARAISTLVFASTIGAVGGPALVKPLGDMVESWGIDPLAGPMFGGALLMLIGGFILMFMLFPDPRDIAKTLASSTSSTTNTNTNQPTRSLGEIFGLPGFQMAVVAMIFGQVVMVLVMTVTSLHMSHHDHDLGEISLVFAAHTFGMFGVSFATGWFADRFGRYTTIATGAVILIIGSLLAPVSLMTPWIALALFLVGFGWNMCYIGGSTLLSDTVTPAERGQIQGLSDLSVNLSAASSSLSSGFVMAAFGYTMLCVLGAGLCLVPLAMWAWLQLQRRQAASAI
ncbi:MAG: MFS transporter [Roseiflexaceae bacterium]